MVKKQNKTNRKVSDEIKSSIDEHIDSEVSVSGFKERQMEGSMKNLKK